MERKRLNRLKVVLAEKNMTNKRLADWWVKTQQWYQSGLPM